MTAPENVLLFVSGFGILQAFLLGVLLLAHPKSDKTVGRFLAAYVVLFSLPMFIPVVQHMLSWQYISFVEPLLLLIGPMLYLYVCSYKEPITFRKAFPHFILMVVYGVWSTYQFTVMIHRYPATTDIPPEVMRGPVFFTRALVRISQMVFYYFLAQRALKQYQASINNLYSETSRINLSWVRWLINAYIILVIVMICFYALIIKFPAHGSILVLANTALITPYIYLVAFKGLTQPTIWQLKPTMDKHKVQEELREAECIANNLTVKDKPLAPTDKSGEIAAQVILVLERDKLFQETELSLQQLAEHINIPPYLVSQSINERLQKSFYDLVNGYRVEEAKRLLIDPKNRGYKVLSVGYEAGFNSKTTFNTVFKKFTGVSPSEFRDRHTPVIG